MIRPVLLALALAGGASAGEPPARRLLLASTRSDDAAWAARLESALDASALEPWAVFVRPASDGLGSSLDKTLAKLRPELVTARGELPAQALSLLKGRKIPWRRLPDDPAQAAAAVLGAEARSPSADEVLPPLTVLRTAQAHADADDDAAVEALLQGLLARSPAEPRALLLLSQTELRENNVDAGLRYADQAAHGRAPARVRARALREAAKARVLLGDSDGARRELRRSLTLYGGDPEAALLLAGLSREQPAQALRYARLAAARAGSPRQRAEALWLAGEVRLDLGDEAGARSDLEKALAEGADRLDALRALAHLLRDRPAAAAAYAEEASRLAAVRPAWARGAAFRLCARIWLDLRDYARAAVELRRALALDPDDLDALQGLLQIQAETGRTPSLAPSAEESANPPWKPGDPAAALRADPEDLAALGALIEARISSGDLDAAVDLADRFLDAVPQAPAWEQLSAYVFLARQWIALEEPERARATVERARDLDPGSPVTTALLRQVGRRRSRAAAQIYNLPLDPAQEDLVESYRSIAAAHEKLGDLAGARRSLAAILELSPQDLPALSRLVALETQAGRPDAALAFAQRLVSAAQGASPAECVEAERTLAGVQLALRDPASARRSLERALQSSAASVETWRALIALDESQGRSQAALADFDRLIRAMDGRAQEQAQAYREKSELQMKLHDVDGARTSLERALVAVPQDLETVSRLSQLQLAGARGDMALKEVDQLIVALTRAKSKPSELSAAYRWKARLQSELRRTDGARASLEAALSASPDDLEALRMLCDLDLSSRQPAEALTDCVRLSSAAAAAGPVALAAAERLEAQAHLARQDGPAAERSLEAALAAQPNDFEALGALAELELGEGRPADALPRAARLAELSARGEPAVRAASERLEGRVQLALGDWKAAQDSLRRSLQDQPDAPETLLLLSSASLAGGAVDSAAAEARQALKAPERASAETLGGAHRLLAQIELGEGQEGAARDDLRRTFRLLPGDAGALLLMVAAAGGELERGRWRPADRWLEWALKESHDSFAPALRLMIELETDRGRLRRALAYADRLVASSRGRPSDLSRAYAQRAQVRLALGDQAGADDDLSRSVAGGAPEASTLWLLAAQGGMAPEKTLALLDSSRPGEASAQAVWRVARGMTLLALKQESSAREEFAAAVAVDSATACLGQELRQRRDRLAASYFDACLGAFPSDASLYSDRGVARYQAGDRDGAEADFRQALRLRPGLLAARLSLVAALAADRRPADALAAAEEGLALTAGRDDPLYPQLAALASSLQKQALPSSR